METFLSQPPYATIYISILSPFSLNDHLFKNWIWWLFRYCYCDSFKHIVICKYVWCYELFTRNTFILSAKDPLWWQFPKSFGKKLSHFKEIPLEKYSGCFNLQLPVTALLNGIFQTDKGRYCTIVDCGWWLTHWGRVRHIRVSKLTTNGSDNDLSSGQRQAIIWTNAGILLIRPLKTNFSEIVVWKWRPSCPDLGELIIAQAR